MPEDYEKLDPISFGAFFLELPSDLSKCTKCKDQIFGKMYVPNTMVSDSLDTEFRDMPVKLCQSCYEMDMGMYNGPEGMA